MRNIFTYQRSALKAAMGVAVLALGLFALGCGPASMDEGDGFVTLSAGIAPAPVTAGGGVAEARPAGLCTAASGGQCSHGGCPHLAALAQCPGIASSECPSLQRHRGSLTVASSAGIGGGQCQDHGGLVASPHRASCGPDDGPDDGESDWVAMYD